jgi:hypothetical protein
MSEPDISKIKEPITPQAGPKERKEQEYLLSSMERQNDWEKAVHSCKMWLLRIALLIIVIAIFVRTLALLIPPLVPWMTPEQTGKVDEFFIHGTIGALIANIIRRAFRFNAVE